MSRQRVEEIRERWTGPLTEMYPSGTEEADYRDVRDLLAEIDQLRALVELMILVGPRENIFHTLPQIEHFDTWAGLVMALSADLFDDAVA